MESRTITNDPGAKRPSLYERLGEDVIVKVITEFYVRAFQDPIIGHIFLHHDREAITASQIKFAISMLGGPKLYRGKPLTTAHQPLPIRPPHFGRRQILMREVLTDFGVERELADAWLAMEEDLKPLILQSQTPCNHPSA